MEVKIVFWIISALFSIVIFFLSYMIKNINSRLNCLEEKTHQRELEIIQLREKLWSKEDLENTVEEAVERVFLRWENNQLKELRVKS